MSAILLLDGVMIIISYTSPTITISLSLSIWSQFAMQASTIVRENVSNTAKKRKKSRFLDFEKNVKNAKKRT